MDILSGLEVFIFLVEKSGNKSLGVMCSNCPPEHFSSGFFPSRRGRLLPFQEGDEGRRAPKTSSRTQRCFADESGLQGSVKATILSWQVPLWLTSTSSCRSTVSVGVMSCDVISLSRRGMGELQPRGHMQHANLEDLLLIVVIHTNIN